MEFSSGINNRVWQLILIPLIALVVSIVVALNQDNKNLEFIFPFNLFFTILVFTFCIWEVNLLVYKKLDKNIPFYENPKKRLLKQIVLSFLVTIFTFCILYFGKSILVQSGFSLNNFIQFLFVAICISIVINLFYIITYLNTSIFFREKIKTDDLSKEIAVLLKKNLTNDFQNMKNINQSLLIESGNKTINMLFSDIAFIKSSEGIVEVVTVYGKSITTNYNSFNLISKQLPTAQFFQLNRQIITNIKSIKKFEDNINRKLIVEIVAFHNAEISEIVSISRYRNSEFKQWIAKQIK